MVFVTVNLVTNLLYMKSKEKYSEIQRFLCENSIIYDIFIISMCENKRKIRKRTVGDIDESGISV